MSQVRITKKKNYEISTLKHAVSMVKSKAMSLRQASKQFQIPKSTLSDKVNNKTEIELKPRTVLTPQEETKLATWVTDMSKIGYGRTKKELLLTVKKILDADGRKTPFKHNYPGKDWYSGFINRHPEISCRTPMQLSKERAVITPEKLIRWFNDFKSFMDSEVNDDTIFNDPTRWYNADESGFPLCPKSGKVLALRGQTNVYNFTSSDKTQITVLACMSASGHYLKPMIVYPGQRFSYNPVAAFPESVFGRSESGWMDSELFKTWLSNVFVPEIASRNVKKPIVLFVDGHSTHMSLEVSDICRDNNIVLYCLLEHASHLIQPCDLKLFSSLKESWKQAVRDFQMEHIGECVTKRDFATVFKGAWEKSTTLEISIKGFRDAGLFPLDINRVLSTVKLAPSTVFTSPPSSNPSQPVSPIAGSSKSLLQTTVTTDNNMQVDMTVNRDIDENTECNREIYQLIELPLFHDEHNYSISVSESSLDLLLDDAVFIDNICETIDIKTTSDNTSSCTSKENEPPKTTGVSSAFNDMLTLPNIERKKTNQQRIPLPKAITSNEFREIMLEKQRKKEEQLKAKQLRKETRERKKREKVEEKKRKEAAKEEKKMIKEMKQKLLNQKKTQEKTQRKQSMKRKRKAESETDESATEEPPLQNDSDNELDMPPISVSECYRCNGPEDGIPSNWIGCSRCARWLHRACVTSVDLLSLDEEAIENLYFECDYC